MAPTGIKYLGELPGTLPPPRRQRIVDGLRKIPIWFTIVVIAPTLVAAFYFFLIATPRYVSETKFIVRSQKNEQPSSIGVALQGVGIPATSTDSFAVHEYVKSPDALQALMRQRDIVKMYSGPNIDMFSRLPRPWSTGTFDDFYKGFKNYLTVGYDATTGISVIRVEAFRPEDAQALADGYLNAGEELVNRLNERSAAGAVADAERALIDAQQRMNQSQVQLTAFRNREGSLDPARTAVAAGELIGALSLTLAQARAERAQIAADAPQSPQISALDSRVRALTSQIEAESQRLAGDASSLAPKIGVYEALVLEREMAEKNLANANVTLVAARLESRRQKLYIERVVAPSKPVTPSQPHKLMSVLSILLSCLVAYGIGWLIVAGLRESEQN